MGICFLSCITFNQSIRDWDVSKVTSMASNVFRNAESFNHPLGKLEYVSGVTDMYAMFCDAYEFNQPIENWDIKGVKRTSRMFLGARLFNQNITSWDFGNVTDFEDMFLNAHSDMIDQHSVKLNSFSPKEIKVPTLSFHIPFYQLCSERTIHTKEGYMIITKEMIFLKLLFFFNGCVLGEFEVPKKLKIHIDIDKYETDVHQFILST